MILSFSVSHTLCLSVSVHNLFSLSSCLSSFLFLKKLYVCITATYLKICLPVTTVWQTVVDGEWERGNLGVLGVGSGHLRECQGGRGSPSGEEGTKEAGEGDWKGW